MTDTAYLCHHCSSARTAESIRKNLLLDLRTAASHEASGRRGMLGLRERFTRWRMMWSIAPALWPRYRDHAGGARQLPHRQPAPTILIALSTATCSNSGGAEHSRPLEPDSCTHTRILPPTAAARGSGPAGRESQKAPAPARDSPL